MHRHALLLSLLCWQVAAAGTDGQRRAAKDLVGVSLLTDVSSLEGGGAFTLGVLLKIEPGYHIYWTNPGDSGMATSVKLQLPAGVSEEAIAFPVPQRLSHAGDVVNFGYEGEVMLTARCKADGRFRPGDALKVGVSVSWLVCKDVCVPGRTHVETSLKVGDRAPGANEALFAQWASRMPREVSEDVARVTVSTGNTPEQRRLQIKWAKSAAAMDLFPEANDAATIENVQIDNERGESSIRFRIRMLQGQRTNDATLGLVLAYRGEDGARRGLKTRVAFVPKAVARE